MDNPAQRPPVERQYLRLVVGRKGKPSGPGDSDEPVPTRGKARRRGKAREESRDGDYVVELTAFHVRPRRRPFG
jgi:hypothetical protein